MHFTEAGTSAFEGGRYRIAAEKWQDAYRIAQDFDEGDPRLAGSLNNMAIAFRINNDFEQAGRCYRNALENWESAFYWIDRMRLTQRARSSLFHLRMESKHRKKYDNIARKNYKKLLSAGQAGTLNNLAELFQATKRFNEAERYYHQALRKRADSMDKHESGVAIINMNLASLSDTFNKLPETALHAAQKTKGSAGFISQAEKQGWVVDKPSEFTDEGRLMAAIFLTYLVDHTHVNP